MRSVKILPILFILLLHYTTSDIYEFSDCGEYLHILRVKLGNCVDIPCRVNIRRKHDFFIEVARPDNEPVPKFTSLSAKADIYQLGAYWPLSITPDNACNSWNCPLTDSVRNATFNASIDFSAMTILRSGRLRVQGLIDPHTPAFCVDLSVTLTY